jgi:hypothetical protein
MWKIANFCVRFIKSLFILICYPVSAGRSLKLGISSPYSPKLWNFPSSKNAATHKNDKFVVGTAMVDSYIGTEFQLLSSLSLCKGVTPIDITVYNHTKRNPAALTLHC